jgi:2-hydroxy-3-keto-5-methylthiopentenyl-1-phosphate phosphatase
MNPQTKIKNNLDTLILHYGNLLTKIPDSREEVKSIIRENMFIAERVDSFKETWITEIPAIVTSANFICRILQLIPEVSEPSNYLVITRVVSNLTYAHDIMWEEFVSNLRRKV